MKKILILIIFTTILLIIIALIPVQTRKEFCVENGYDDEIKDYQTCGLLTCVYTSYCVKLDDNIIVERRKMLHTDLGYVFDIDSKEEKG